MNGVAPRMQQILAADVTSLTAAKKYKAKPKTSHSISTIEEGFPSSSGVLLCQHYSSTNRYSAPAAATHGEPSWCAAHPPATRTRMELLSV